MLIIKLFVFTISLSIGPHATASANGLYQVYLADVDQRDKEFRIDIPQFLNPRGFSMFESYIRNGVDIDDYGNPNIGLVIGEITRAIPTQNHHFHFRFIIESVRWNDFALQSCDARLSHVEKNLDVWLLRRQFCPWTTRSLMIRITKNGQLLWERGLPSTNRPNKYSSSNTDLQENEDEPGGPMHFLL